MTVTATEFPAAAWDRSTWIMTAATVILVAAFTASVAMADGANADLFFGAGIPVLVLVVAFGLSPRGYRVSPDGRLQVLRRWFGSKSFRVNSVEATPMVFGLGGIRLAGSSGVFGWYGWFWRKGAGRYRAYVTDRAQLVLCNGPDGLVVISPRDPAAFVSAAQP